MPTAKEVMEHLARAKGTFHRHDIPRCLVSLANGLKALLDSPAIVGRDKQSAQMAVAELAQLLARTEEAQEFMLEGYSYERGKEKGFLSDTITFYKRIDHAAKQEKEAQTQARKLQMDRLLIRGGKMLGHGKLQEALGQFDEAAGLYKDEHIIFTMIARRLLQAELPGSAEAALPWAKRAVESDGGNSASHVVLAQTFLALGDETAARDACAAGLAAVGPQAEMLLLLAQLEEKAGSEDAALKHYQGVVEHGSTDHLMRKKAQAGISRLRAD